MALKIGNGTIEVKNKNKQIEIIPIVNTVKKGIDKGRFNYDVNKIAPPLIVKAWGYSFCDNCNTERSFKRTDREIVCNNCSYIISYL